MVNHIYGKLNLLNTTDRSHMFINELRLYSDYFQKEVKVLTTNYSEKQSRTLENFKSNLLKGIQYYNEVINELKEESQEYRLKMKEELKDFESKILSTLVPQIPATCHK
jgi:hypothetical protein